MVGATWNQVLPVHMIEYTSAGPESAGGGVVGAGRAGVRVGAGQYFSGAGQPVLGDDLMADAVSADVVEALDAELGGELAGVRSAGGVFDGRRGHRVVHHDRQLVGIMNAKRLDPHRRELQIDQHRHVDVDDDGLARGHPVQAGLAGEDLLDDGHAHRTVLHACVFGVEVKPLRHPDQVEEFGGPGGQMVGDVAAVEFTQAFQHAEDRAGERVAGMNGDGVAQLLQPRRRLQRRHAAQHQIDQQRSLDLAGDAFDLLDALRGLDEDHVRTGLGVSIRPLDRGVQAERSPRVGPRDDEQVVVGARVERGGQRLFELRGVDDVLVGQVPAAFREYLVLQLDCRDAGLLVEPDGAHHVHRCAVAGVGVGDQRDVAEHADQHPGALGHLGGGDQSDVRQAEPGRRHTGAGHVCRRLTRATGQMRRYPVENTWCDDEFAAIEQGA